MSPFRCRPRQPRRLGVELEGSASHLRAGRKALERGPCVCVGGAQTGDRHTSGRGKCAGQVEKGGGEAGVILRGSCGGTSQSSEPCRVPTAGTVMASDLTVVLHRAKRQTRNSKATLASQAVWLGRLSPGSRGSLQKHDPPACASLPSVTKDYTAPSGHLPHLRAALLLTGKLLGLCLLMHITAAPRTPVGPAVVDDSFSLVRGWPLSGY